MLRGYISHEAQKWHLSDYPFQQRFTLVACRISPSCNMPLHYTCVGLARTMYIRCIYGIFGRELIKYTVIYGVYIRFWPTLHMRQVGDLLVGWRDVGVGVGVGVCKSTINDQ